MIRLGRYDVFDKWDIVCRSWAGRGPIDVGVDRHNRESLPRWQYAANAGGIGQCQRYVNLKCESLNLETPPAAPAGETGEDAELREELSRLMQEIGHAELWQRCLRFFDAMKSTGWASPSTGDLPPHLAERLKEVFKQGAFRRLAWTDDPGEIPEIEELRVEGRFRPFPHAAIKGKKNVLAMFCVRFYGVIDVIHIYDARPEHVTLVDLDEKCLDAVKLIYPRDWTYVLSDYKAFLKQAEEQGWVYDTIVTDPWRAQCAEVGWDMLPAIMRRCDTFVAHYVDDMFNELGVERDDLEGLSRAIARRTGVDVVVTESVPRSKVNSFLAMHKRIEATQEKDLVKHERRSVWPLEWAKKTVIRATARKHAGTAG